MDTISESNQIEKLQTNISIENAIQRLHPTNFIKEEMQDLKEINIDEMIEGEAKVIDLKDNFTQRINSFRRPF